MSKPIRVIKDLPSLRALVASEAPRNQRFKLVNLCKSYNVDPIAVVQECMDVTTPNVKIYDDRVEYERVAIYSKSKYPIEYIRLIYYFTLDNLAILATGVWDPLDLMSYDINNYMIAITRWLSYEGHKQKEYTLKYIMEKIVDTQKDLDYLKKIDSLENKIQELEERLVLLSRDKEETYAMMRDDKFFEEEVCYDVFSKIEETDNG